MACLVTIVTPCLDPGPRLERCLNSVANQTYRTIQHIVVDGGSTDGTLALLRDRSVVHISEPDRGQTHALNKGFDLAQGSILTWLNADDELLPGTVQRVVRRFCGEADVDLVYGDCEEWSANGRRHIISPPEMLGPDSFNYGNILAQPGTFFSARALEGAGALDESFRLAMDFDLWLRFTDRAIRSGYIPKTLARFEVHGSSKTGTLPVWEFHFEEAHALLKSGRTEFAALSLGRAAVASLNRSGAQMNAVIAEALRLKATSSMLATLPTDLVTAAARVEGAIHSGSPLDSLRLIPVSPWRYPHLGRRALSAPKRAAVRALRKLRLKPADPAQAEIADTRHE